MNIRLLVASLIMGSVSSTLFSSPTLINSPAQHEASFNSPNPILILYTDPARCTPCRLFEPIFNKTSTSYTDIEFYVVNTSTPGMQDVLKTMAIQSIPTIVFGFNKKIVMRSFGKVTEAELKRKITSFKNAIFGNEATKLTQTADHPLKK